MRSKKESKLNKREFIVKNHQMLSFSRVFAVTGQGENVFWPGCAVLSMGSELSKRTYDFLKKLIPNLTYSTACCGKPSKYILGGKDFPKRRTFLEQTLSEKGVRTIYTLCPNCFDTLREIEGVRVVSVWAMIDQNFPDEARGILEGRALAIHDPCPIGSDIESAQYVRNILEKMGAEVLEFKNNREKTLCCGKKNMIMALDPKRGQRMFNARAKQAPCRDIVTYCASCKDTFVDNEFECSHVLELLFQIKASPSWVNRYKAVKSLERKG